MGRNGEISDFHRLIGFRAVYIILTKYLLVCINIHLYNCHFFPDIFKKADKNCILRFPFSTPLKTGMYHDVSLQSISISDSVPFFSFFFIFLSTPQRSSKVLKDKEIYFFEISYCTSCLSVIYFFQQKYYAPCMKVQLSCGALLEVNGFLCFPVSFTITKVNGDCLCLKIGHSGEIPDKYLPPFRICVGNWYEKEGNYIV